MRFLVKIQCMLFSLSCIFSPIVLAEDVVEKSLDSVLLEGAFEVFQAGRIYAENMDNLREKDDLIQCGLKYANAYLDTKISLKVENHYEYLACIHASGHPEIKKSQVTPDFQRYWFEFPDESEKKRGYFDYSKVKMASVPHPLVLIKIMVEDVGQFSFLHKEGDLKSARMRFKSLFSDTVLTLLQKERNGQKVFNSKMKEIFSDIRMLCSEHTVFNKNEADEAFESSSTYSEQQLAAFGSKVWSFMMGVQGLLSIPEEMQKEMGEAVASTLNPAFTRYLESQKKGENAVFKQTEFVKIGDALIKDYENLKISDEDIREDIDAQLSVMQKIIGLSKELSEANVNSQLKKEKFKASNPLEKLFAI
jgi:hypothetical protein